MSLPPIPAGWPGLRAERDRPYFGDLEGFLDRERQEETVFPPRDQVFRALELTPHAEVRVVLIGQDPYHGPGQAQGLAFSVPPGVDKPPSLRNLFKELHDDLGVPIPDAGDLSAWTRRGVLLLNAVLTVRAGQPGSHRGKGWERFTDAVIEEVNRSPATVVFLLLGNRAFSQANELLTGAGREPVDWSLP